MKILLFTDSLGAGGAQRQLVGLAVLLKKKGLKLKYVHTMILIFMSNILRIME